MRNVVAMTEVWVCECRSCGQTSARKYEVWRTADFSGGDVVVWRYHGLPCLPPWGEPSCPRCGGLRVKMRPEDVRETG